jgi:hypothetical protein
MVRDLLGGSLLRARELRPCSGPAGRRSADATRVDDHQPAELAQGFVSFASPQFASPQSSFNTGELLAVTGGRTMT